jgi:hypothetical protein
MYPTISTELWKNVQSIDLQIIQLSFVEGALNYNAGWAEAVSVIDMSGDKDMTFTSKLNG